MFGGNAFGWIYPGQCYDAPAAPSGGFSGGGGIVTHKKYKNIEEFLHDWIPDPDEDELVVVLAALVAAGAI